MSLLATSGIFCCPNSSCLQFYIYTFTPMVPQGLIFIFHLLSKTERMEKHFSGFCKRSSRVLVHTWLSTKMYIYIKCPRKSTISLALSIFFFMCISWDLSFLPFCEVILYRYCHCSASNNQLTSTSLEFPGHSKLHFSLCDMMAIYKSCHIGSKLMEVLALCLKLIIFDESAHLVVKQWNLI